MNDKLLDEYDADVRNMKRYYFDTPSELPEFAHARIFAQWFYGQVSNNFLNVFKEFVNE